MKKLFSLLVLATLVATMTLSLVGCGSSSTTPKATTTPTTKSS